MDSQLRSQVVFHLTGRQGDAANASAAPQGMRPALLAPYRHLDAIRHDFPVVFASGKGEYVVSLSAAVDGALRAVAPPGLQGEALRKRALQVERNVRSRVAAGGSGTLQSLWDAAVAELMPETNAEAFQRDATRVRDALAVSGVLAGCDPKLPARFVRHAWWVVQKEKSQAARARIDALMIRLDDILRADYARSSAALMSKSLRATFGVAHRELFDFSAMSRLLNQPAPHGGLPPARRKRIEDALAVLGSQAFFTPALEADEGGGAEFVFDAIGTALDAFLKRLPEMVALHKALQVAALEVDGRYVDEVHDPIFDAMDEHALGAEDLQLFPDFLVCTSNAAAGAHAALTEALSAGVPLKVMVRLDDLVEQGAPGRTRFAFGMRSSQLASAVMSLGDVYVLQSTSSNLLQMRDRVQRGLRHAGPALFSVYAAQATAQVPGYLASAAAMQARAFPAFSYDPAAGPDLSSRFSLENNPQPEQDWPVDQLSYADPDLQSVTEDVAFTFVDFALCDPRYDAHFAVVPRADWDNGLIPAAQWLAEPPADASTGVPYVVAVDDADMLCRLVVDDQLMRAALRCRENWHRLQELAGINDSRMERLLAKERQAWEEQHARVAAAAPAAAPAAAEAAAVPAAAASAPADAPAAAAAPEPARNPDEAYVETIRCSSCNECTLAFPKMFAYNEDKQAYIKDLKSGTYRQLIEAAEACQVSVIHPGKPWDPDEPGLEELLERAKPFL